MSAAEPMTLTVLLRGDRLQIAADVSRDNIQRLRKIIDKFEEILALLQSRNQQSRKVEDEPNAASRDA